MATRPQRQEILAEIQVRTIFEEGWSEIDHKVRYPNFSDNALLAVLLGVFNRMAGSADEMGTCVQQLVQEIDRYEAAAHHQREQNREQIARLETLARELSQHKQEAVQEGQLERIELLASELRRSSEEPPPKPPSANLMRALTGVAGVLSMAAFVGLGPPEIAGVVTGVTGLAGVMVAAAEERKKSQAVQAAKESISEQVVKSTGEKPAPTPRFASTLEQKSAPPASDKAAPPKGPKKGA